MRRIAVLLSLGLLLGSGRAHADRDAINLGQAPLPPASDGLVQSLSPEALAPGALRANVWMGYARAPLVLHDVARGEEFALIADRVFTDYALALGVLNRLELSVALPFILNESGHDLSEVIDRPKLPSTATGNLELGYKTTWLKPGDVGGFTLGSRGIVALPTGSKAAFLSSGAPEGELGLLSALHLMVFEVRAGAGVRLRGTEPTLLQVRYGNELRWNLGLQFRPILLGWDQSGGTRIGLEFSGASGLSGLASSGANGALVGLGVSRRMGSLSFNAGCQLPLGSRPGNPQMRAFFGLGWTYDE